MEISLKRILMYVRIHLKFTGNAVARRDDVDTVIGSWIVVQNPNKRINNVIKLIDFLKKNPNTKLDVSPKVIKQAYHIMRRGAIVLHTDCI